MDKKGGIEVRGGKENLNGIYRIWKYEIRIRGDVRRNNKKRI